MAQIMAYHSTESQLEYKGVEEKKNSKLLLALRLVDSFWLREIIVWKADTGRNEWFSSHWLAGAGGVRQFQ